MKNEELKGKSPDELKEMVGFLKKELFNLRFQKATGQLEKTARVRVVPGSPRWFGAGAAGHVRLSLATTRGVLDEALARIERAWPAITAR